MQACKGYVATTFNVIEVFGVVLSGFYQLLFLFIFYYFWHKNLFAHKIIFLIYRIQIQACIIKFDKLIIMFRRPMMFLLTISNLGFQEKTCNWVQFFLLVFYPSCRYVDDADMDVVPLYVTYLSARLNIYYNYNSNVTCTLPLFDLMK